MDCCRSLLNLTFFSIFDIDGNNSIDFSELASGLSILCGSTGDEKIAAAFDLYDYNGDNLNTVHKILAGIVFKVVF